MASDIDVASNIATGLDIHTVCAQAMADGYNWASLMDHNNFKRWVAEGGQFTSEKPNALWFSAIIRDNEWESDDEDGNCERSTKPATFSPEWYQWIHQEYHYIESHGARDLIFAKEIPADMLTQERGHIKHCGTGQQLPEDKVFKEIYGRQRVVWGWVATQGKGIIVTPTGRLWDWDVKSMAVWDTTGIKDIVVYRNTGDSQNLYHYMPVREDITGAVRRTRIAELRKQGKFDLAIQENLDLLAFERQSAAREARASEERELVSDLVETAHLDPKAAEGLFTRMIKAFRSLRIRDGQQFNDALDRQP